TRFESARDASLGTLSGDADSRQRARLEARDKDLATLAVEESTRRDELRSAWKKAIVPVHESVTRLNEVASHRFPTLDTAFAERWHQPSEFSPIVRFGHLDANLA